MRIVGVNRCYIARSCLIHNNTETWKIFSVYPESKEQVNTFWGEKLIISSLRKA